MAVFVAVVPRSLSRSPPRFEALRVWSLKGPSSVRSERFIKKNLPTKGDEIPTMRFSTVKHGENGKTKRQKKDMKLKGWILEFFVWLVEIMAQKSVKKFDAEVVLILRGGGM